uniref:Uncharacterized protein n=1 Tax=Wuchereria bancrofti TaxID=6293 RepID=A0AAF5Q2V0_WUCBA
MALKLLETNLNFLMKNKRNLMSKEFSSHFDHMDLMDQIFDINNLTKSVLRHYWPFKSLNLKKRSKTPCGMHKIQVLTSSIAVTINDGLRLVEKRR